MQYGDQIYGASFCLLCHRKKLSYEKIKVMQGYENILYIIELILFTLIAQWTSQVFSLIIYVYIYNNTQ